MYRDLTGGTRLRSWLRHCATSQKVAGLIPDDVVGIFHGHNPAGRTMALGLTQPLTEMSTKNISWGIKAVGAYGWQPYHLHVPTVLKYGCLNLLEASGPVETCNGTALQGPHLTFTFSFTFTSFHTVLLSCCNSASDIRCGRYWYSNVISVGTGTVTWYLWVLVP